MTMKRLAALMLAAVMLLATLAGCGGPDSSVPGGSVTPLNPGGNADSTNPTANDKPLSLGRLEGGVYANKYIGIACKLDESWTFYSAEELQELPDMVGDMFEGSQLGDAMKDMEQIMDMQAECADDLTTMNIVYQKLSMTERLSYATMSDEQIVDTTLQQRDMLEEAYSQAGITVKSMEKKTVTFLGEERAAIYTVAEIQGIAYYILQLHDYHLGSYGVTITVGSYVQDKTASLLELFYAL